MPGWWWRISPCMPREQPGMLSWSASIFRASGGAFCAPVKLVWFQCQNPLKPSQMKWLLDSPQMTWVLPLEGFQGCWWDGASCWEQLRLARGKAPSYLPNTVKLKRQKDMQCHLGSEPKLAEICWKASTEFSRYWTSDVLLWPGYNCVTTSGGACSDGELGVCLSKVQWKKWSEIEHRAHFGGFQFIEGIYRP